MIQLLQREWPCLLYDTLTHNCCHFVNDFCQRLGVGSIPSWITHLAGVGAATSDFTDTTCCRMVASQVSFQFDKVCCIEDQDYPHPCEVLAVPASSYPQSAEGGSPHSGLD